MSRARIKVITIGHLPLRLNLKRIADWKSALFEITGEVENLSLRCDSDGADWEFSDKLVNDQLPVEFDADLLFAIVNVPLQSNWYARRLGSNRVVFSFHEIKTYLADEKIPLENAIFRLLYAYTLVFRRFGNTLPPVGDVSGFTHDETRGCLFDMNGIKSDIVESCITPIICDECQEHMRTDRVSTSTLMAAQREIRRIRKPLYYRIVDTIKLHPIYALIISSVFAVLLGAIGSLLASIAYDEIKAFRNEGIGAVRERGESPRP